MTNTADVRRSINRQQLTLAASFALFYEKSRAENQFLRSLNRSRQSESSGESHRAKTAHTQPPTRTDGDTPVRGNTPTATRTVSSALAQRKQLPLSPIAMNAASISGLCVRPAGLIPGRIDNVALLQSSRAQELRAEIERCLTLAMRLAGSAKRSDEFRWSLSPSLFPDTTVVLRRQTEGWSLHVVSADEQCSAVLRSGVSDLQQRFDKSGLGTLVVTVDNEEVRK